MNHADANSKITIFVVDAQTDERAWATVVAGGSISVVRWEDSEQLLGALHDCAMPHLIFACHCHDTNAINICRTVRAHPTANEVPVIVLLERGHDELVRSALGAGASDVLQKPVAGELLNARIRSYLALRGQSDKIEKGAYEQSKDLERKLVVMRSELNEREQALARAEFLFNRDLITGLPNRRHMQELMERSRVRCMKNLDPMSVLGLSIANFQSLQTSMPRDEFDRLIAEIGERIQQILRPSDFVGRVAEDTFVAVLDSKYGESVSAAREGAEFAVKRVISLLQENVRVDSGVDETLELNSAVALYPDDGDSSKELLRALDKALVPPRNPLLVERRRRASPSYASAMALEIRLRQAIDSERLIPYYQPKICARTGVLLGAEALIRWPLRSGEHIGPSQFVPVAESGGLIPALDNYVLHRTCKQIAEWQERYSGFRISVNLSAVRLGDRSVFDRLKQILEETGALPQHLELEITESALITDFVAATKWLNAIRELGVSVALDDFGTGYSSLAYLRQLPLDVIKIDRSFVQGLEFEESTLAIVRAMVSMAIALGMGVVAEGIETPKQAELLTDLGCDCLQGFLYSAAVPAERFKAMMSQGRLEPNSGCPDTDDPYSGRETELETKRDSAGADTDHIPEPFGPLVRLD